MDEKYEKLAVELGLKDEGYSDRCCCMGEDNPRNDDPEEYKKLEKIILNQSKIISTLYDEVDRLKRYDLNNEKAIRDYSRRLDEYFDEVRGLESIIDELQERLKKKEESLKSLHEAIDDIKV